MIAVGFFLVLGAGLWIVLRGWRRGWDTTIGAIELSAIALAELIGIALVYAGIYH